MRRRAETRLWQERSDAATVHNFTRDRPASAMGRFALARVLVAEGRLDDAATPGSGGVAVGGIVGAQ